MSARSRLEIANNAAAIIKNDDFWMCTSTQAFFKAAHGGLSSPLMALADTANAATITIGVPSTILVTSTISPPGDTDVFAVSVTAGRTYMVSLYGSGATPLQDSVIFLYNQLGNFVNADDDGGSGTNSLLTFTPNVSGTWFVEASAYPGSGGTGQYTLDVVLQPLTDVVGDTFGAAPTLNLGINYGFIDAGVPSVYGPGASETDTFKINMTAGKFYVIEVAGGADYDSDPNALPAGELDPIIFLYDSLGNLVASNDDISFPSDISSRLGFFAETSGTYFLDVQSYAPWTGGFSVTLNEQVIDLNANPLDAINWFSADTIDIGPGNIVKVFFAPAGESYDELADNGTDPLPSYGWNATEKAAVMNALLEYTKILGITYQETSNEAEAEFRLITTTSTQYGAYFYPQDPAFGDAQGIGAFNVNSGGWDKLGFSTQDIPGDQLSLTQGGFSFGVLLHELGHAHGLAHPHDNGGGSDVMAGVIAATGSYGVYNLNQGIYTVMSYNDAWDFHPDGPSPFTIAGISNGWSGTLSAFDIALLQQRYGVANPYATGNTVYTLDDVQAIGTYYETIWDTGGTDEIRYNGVRDAQIDLTAATLDYTPTGGGVVSFVDDIHGGYTIANGVVIENATGGGGNDIIIGNSVANILTGNNGDDFLMGRAGADTLRGGSGSDTASYALATAGVVASLATNTGTAGEAAGDTFNSIEKLEGSNFNDTLTSGGGADTLTGLDGNDSLVGGNANDVLDGGNGNDSLDGGNDNDTLTGGAGNDVLEGGNGIDTMNGGGDTDTLNGGNGNDVMNGGAGTDTLSGGNDNDSINGGAGNDLMSGGNGNDIFFFTEIGGADRIVDYNRGADKVNLSAIDAIAGGADNAFTFIGGGAFSNVAGQLRAYSSSGSYFVAGDVNGDGVADFTIQTNILMVNSDFVL
ncbi:MAG TPA: pre-peptidase C-terminal domain-containing protein [Allosphingosinicella sp.]|nr:pre-peptidase C-terminal domain-containing protein [Allosphingosinicella sp.]